MSVLYPVPDVLTQAPIFTASLVIGLGTAAGQALLGSIRFGAAGAFFVGLAVDALDFRLGADLTLLYSLGLTLFCYTVGLVADNTFLHDLRRQLPLTVLYVIAFVIVGVTGGLYSHLTGVNPAMDSGAYAGILTSSVLDVAIEAVGIQEPAVGYALTYSVGVVITIFIVVGVVRRTWPGQCDPRPASTDGIAATSAYLLQRVVLGKMKASKEGCIRISYLERDGEARVVVPDEELLPGGKIVIVGTSAAVGSAMHDLGTGLHNCLARDRAAVDFRHLTVSSTWAAGHTITEVDMSGRLQGVITRVKHDDLDLLTHEDLVPESDDRMLAVVPNDELERAADWFGDSKRSTVQIDAFSVRAGIALGVLLGLVATLPPGGITLRLGVATEPLVVDMVLGWMGRTGPSVWGPPHAANSVIRQLGLLFFLAAIGLVSGPGLAASAFLIMGLRVGVLAALIVVANTIALLARVRRIRTSARRVSGGLAGLVGQPVIPVFALPKRNDERIKIGYTTLFALTIVVKTVMVQVLMALWTRNPMAVGGGVSPGRRIRSE